MSDYWQSQVNTATTSLTRETLDAAFEQIKKTPRTICIGSNRHVVSPKAEGWTTCSQCFTAVYVPVGEPEKPNPEKPAGSKS
jgi:hypothetical protein